MMDGHMAQIRILANYLFSNWILKMNSGIIASKNQVFGKILN